MERFSTTKTSSGNTGEMNDDIVKFNDCHLAAEQGDEEAQQRFNEM